MAKPKFPVAVAQLGSTYCVNEPPPQPESIDCVPSESEMAVITYSAIARGKPGKCMSYVESGITKDQIPASAFIDSNDFDVSTLSFDRHLTSRDLTAIAELKEYMAVEHSDATLDEPSIGTGGDWKLARFLREVQYDIPAAAEALLNFIDFRAEFELDTMTLASLGLEPRDLWRRPGGDGGGYHGFELLQPDVRHGSGADQTFITVMICIYFFEWFDRKYPRSFDKFILYFHGDWLSSIPTAIPMFAVQHSIHHRFYPYRTGPTIVVRPTPILHILYHIKNQHQRFKERLASRMAEESTIHDDQDTNDEGPDPTPVSTRGSAASSLLSLTPGIAMPCVGRHPVLVVGGDLTAMTKIFPSNTLPPEYGGTMIQQFDADATFSDMDGDRPGLSEAALAKWRERFDLHFDHYKDGGTRNALRKGTAYHKVTGNRWMRVVLVLRPHVLILRTSLDEIIPVSVIPMDWVEIYPNGGKMAARPHAITIATLKRDYLVAFGTSEEKEDWVTALRQVASENVQQDS